MTVSPFRPHSAPSRFVGRTAELGYCRGYLEALSAGESHEPLCFVAPRGIGKTSLLKQAERLATEAGFLALRISCAQESSFLAALDQALQISPWKLKGAQLGVNGASLSFEHNGQTQVTPTSVQNALRSMATPSTLKSLKGLRWDGLVVLIDEIQAGTITDLATWLNAVQLLVNEEPVPRVATIWAGLPSSREKLTEAATFAERTRFVTVGRLTKPTDRELLVQTADSESVSWDPRALQAARTFGREHPYLLQLGARAIWDVSNPGPGATLTAAAAAKGLAVATAELDKLFESRWQQASGAQRDFLKAMAGLRQPASRGELAAALGKSTTAISVPRARLIDRGMIEPAAHGKLAFTMPGFREFVQAI